MDYLSQVAYADQNKAAIENYFAAVRVISKKNIIGRGGMIGEAMLTDLDTLNKKAGVKVS
jgi:hypothetical protein